MRFLPRTLAATAVVAGATLLGASLGGMASVDRELAAAVAPAPSTQFDRVAYAPGARDRMACREAAGAGRSDPHDVLQRPRPEL